MKTEQELKNEICEIGKRLNQKGLLASTDGGISVKVNDKEYLCTGSCHSCLMNQESSSGIEINEEFEEEIRKRVMEQMKSAK